ncbi:MATE family efflux transporter [Deltaproteobacteria bacterium]|uniref:Multidrug-efflux transporter n=2 Tax=Candidatus Desulfovibrio trichonymphae TaxID=1725232 RepID=A0A1J1DQE5_9BACT|nr:MATE family efflux pump [Candidatus Desulfovibrio trichonymphae]GHU94510.1 MATE family efflux transporter [Deltaproteobacteria bacterium]GHU98505.1 MATE family efflux transporter [Deltaproteobacteria bacterium]
MNNPDLSTSPGAIWRLTWPQMLMMYLVFFMGFIMVWVAGQISADVQAALGMVTQSSIFLMVVAMALASGATAAIAQSLGARKTCRAQRYIATTVLGSLILGIFVAVAGYCFGDHILVFLMVPNTIMPVVHEIWQVTMLALPAQYLYAATGTMFRATRQVLQPLRVAALVCAVNLLACLGFGLGYFGLPACGYMGLVWTNLSVQVLGAVCNCLLLVRSGYLSRHVLPSLRWLGAGLPYLLRVALPAGAAHIVWQSGYLTLFVLVAALPLDSVNALAGLTAGLRMEALLFLPGMAFNMSVAVLVGNCLGADNPGEAKRVGLQMVGAGTLAMSLIAALLWPFRQEIAQMLSHAPGTQAQIISYLTYNLLSTPFSIASTVMGGIMVGAGATRYNLIIFGGTFWIVRLPLGWLLGHILWGTAAGVFLAMLCSQCLQTCIMLYVVLCCNWTRFAMKNLHQPRHITPH